MADTGGLHRLIQSVKLLMRRDGMQILHNPQSPVQDYRVFVSQEIEWAGEPGVKEKLSMGRYGYGSEYDASTIYSQDSSAEKSRSRQSLTCIKGQY